MNSELQREIQRLERILQTSNVNLSLPSGATDEELEHFEEATNIKLDDNLKDFYRFANGSNNEVVFAVFPDYSYAHPCNFQSISDVIRWWQEFYQTPEPFDPVEEEAGFDWKPDERIRPFWRHPLWLPFAEFNGFSTTIMFDAHPSNKGKYGQIIGYQHDPDEILFVADDFLQFLRISNNLLEQQNHEFFD